MEKIHEKMKYRLAEAMKHCMKRSPVEKITVREITEECGTTRQTFYRNFKDKYDLVNWIFDTEFIELLKHENLNASYTERWAFIEKNCRYFYQNHSFYRKALQIKGQNSFSDHFREYIRPFIAERISSLFGGEQVDEFILDFFVDAVICTMECWLRAKECMPPEQFVEKLKRLTEKCAHSICQEIPQTEQGKISQTKGQ